MGEGSTGEKGSSRKKRVEGCGKNYTRRDLEQAQENFGRGSAGQNIWKVYRELKKVQEEQKIRVNGARHKQKYVDRKLEKGAKAHKR